MQYRKRNKMKPIHIVLITLGSVLCAAALTLIGLGVFGILNADIQTDDTLKIAEAMLNGENVDGQQDLSGGDMSDENLQEAEDMIDEMQGDGSAPADEQVDGSDTTLTPDETSDPGTNKPAGNRKPAASKQPAVSGQPTASNQPDASSQPTPSPTIKKGSVMGILVFDSLGGRKVPVVQGADARQLARGAGHHDRTSMPGAKGNCLIFGHRNTVFRGFGGLKTGDHIQFKVPGATYTYQITNMSIVEPNDELMFRVYDKPVLTLVTCYPFDYVGHAPKRYVVVAELIS